MSYRELVMIDVREVLRRWSAGHSNRKISRETGTHRTTAARYIAAAQGLGIEPGHEFTDDEVHEIAQRVQARPLRDPSEVRRTLDEQEACIAEWLGRKRPLRLPFSASLGSRTLPSDSSRPSRWSGDMSCAGPSWTSIST